MQASRVGRGPIVVVALSIAALAAVPRERSEPAAPARVATVRVELRSPPPPPPQAEPQPPREERCCACAMARNEELWREQQQRERAAKRKRRVITPRE
jgi:hypothetical protein